MKKVFLFVLAAIATIDMDAQQIPTLSPYSSENFKDVTIARNYNDAQIDGLKGKVKSVLELAFNNDNPNTKGDTVKCTYYDINGQINRVRKNGKDRAWLFKAKPLLNKIYNGNKQLISYNQDGNKYVLKYTSLGQLVAVTCSFGSHGYTTTTYNNGRITKIEEYGNVGGGNLVIIDVHTYNYTDSGYDVTLSEQDMSGQYHTQIIYTYDIHNNLTKEAVFSLRTGKLIFTHNYFYVYDENGNMISQSTEYINYSNSFTGEDFSTPRTRKEGETKFIVNETGNWIQRNFNPFDKQKTKTITKRVITYYN